MPPTFQKNLLVIKFEKTLETFLYVLKNCITLFMILM